METRLLQVDCFQFLQHRELRFAWSVLLFYFPPFDFRFVLVQVFQEYSVTLSESSATTESCFQSLQKRYLCLEPVAELKRIVFESRNKRPAL